MIKWVSSIGTFNKIKALKMLAAINEGKILQPMKKEESLEGKKCRMTLKRHSDAKTKVDGKAFSILLLSRSG
jgi:hypothetical protein